MKLENTETHMSLSFTLFYDQIRKAHAIYQMHCFSCDFINRCSDRRQEEIGLCNLPYETLPDEAELLDTAYRIYEEKEDCNIAYNDTLDAVIEEIEQQIADGRLVLSSVQEDSRVAIVIEDGIISAAFSSNPNIRIEITELDKNYADSEQRDTAYKELQNDPKLKSCDYVLSVPGYEKSIGLEVEE